MTQPVLYAYPGRDDLPSPSPPCCKVLLALSYSGLAHEVKWVKGDPRGVSPTGRLPAMKIGGEALSDSVEILDRLEALSPPRRFWPEDPRERARDLVWERYANEHLYWRLAYMRWVIPANAKRTCEVLLAGLPAVARLFVSPIARREARRRARGQGVGGLGVEQVRKEFVRALDAYEAGVGAGPFLEERSEPGRADFAAAGHLPQFAYEGLTPWAGAQLLGRPALIDYVGRVYAACELPIPGALRSGG